jgi:methionine-rich copper-binding protein CopC
MRIVRVLGSAAALVLFGNVAGAHAFLDEADPRVGSTVRAAPREVTLRFTQDLEPDFSSVAITDASGQRVDAGKPGVSGNVMRVPLRPIGAGNYRVTWRVLSTDTHTTEGTFTFGVAAP